MSRVHPLRLIIVIELSDFLCELADVGPKLRLELRVEKDVLTIDDGGDFESAHAWHHVEVGQPVVRDQLHIAIVGLPFAVNLIGEDFGVGDEGYDA